MKKTSVPMDRLAHVKTRKPANAIRSFEKSDYVPAPMDNKAVLLEWMLQPKVIYNAILVAAVLALQLSGAFSDPFITGGTTTGAPAAEGSQSCIVMTWPAGASEEPLWTEKDNFIVRQNGSRKGMLYSVRNCPADSCSGSDLDQYFDTLKWYLDSRARMLQLAHVEYGPRGVEYVNDFYRTAEDFGIASHVRELIRAGKFDFARLSPGNAALLRLMLKHVNEDVPVCYKPNPKAR